MKHADAIHAAIELYRQPVLGRGLQKAELPHGVTDVLRIAAGLDSGPATPTSNMSAKELREASIFYLQSALFQGQPNDRRLLGLPEKFDVQLLRLHKRLISKWLHPDVNHNQWENQLFNRVVAAAERLEESVLKIDAPVVTSQISRPSIRQNQSKRYLARQKPKTFRWSWFFRPLLRYVAVGIVALTLAAAAMLLVNNGPGTALPHFEATN
jgi:hypothetical protein